MRISLSGIAGDSIVDGPGIRLTVFTQGCPHHCPGCHNPHTHDPEGGFWGNTEDIVAAMAENPFCSLLPVLRWQKRRTDWG